MLLAALRALAAAALRVGYASYPPPPAPTPPPVPVGPGSRAMRVRLPPSTPLPGAKKRAADAVPPKAPPPHPPPIDALALLGGPAGPIKRPPPVPAPPPSPPPKPPDLVWKLRAPAPSADGGRGGPQGPAHLSLVGSGGELMRVVLQPPQPVQQTANGQQPLPGPWPPLEHQRPSQPSSAMMLQQANNDGTSGGGYDDDEAEEAPSYGTEIPRPKKKKRRPPHKGPHGSPFKGSTVDKLRAAAAASVKGVAAPAERPPKLEALQVRRLPLPSGSPPSLSYLASSSSCSPAPSLSDQRHPSPGRLR